MSKPTVLLKSAFGILAFMIAWSATSASPARAELILTLSNNMAVPGSSANSFDVNLTNNGTSSADNVLISGFSFEITASSSYVTFGSVTTGTLDAAYIFGAESQFGPDITLAVSSGGSTISAADNFATPFGSITLEYGHTLGLGHVIFSLLADAPSDPIALLFTPFPATGVNGPDPLATPYDVTPPDPANSFIIVQANLVPEPATLIMGLQAILVAGCLAFRANCILVRL
jgi:hypothetical protein